MLDIAIGLLIPFLGTTLGSACVYFMSKDLNPKLEKALSAFAAGVMVAASIWSLIIPAIDSAESLGSFAFFPALVGIWIGTAFLLLLDHAIPHFHFFENRSEGPKSHFERTTLMVLAVTLHNLPEGLAVGVVYAGLLAGGTGITAASALALSLGIAIQNFPEGAIISMPLHSNGVSKNKAFLGGALSGVIEPLAGLLAVLAARSVSLILPYVLGFAAGAMLYVVVDDLIPEFSTGEHSDLGTVCFALGFSVMLVLDVALG